MDSPRIDSIRRVRIRNSYVLPSVVWGTRALYREGAQEIAEPGEGGLPESPPAAQAGGPSS